LDLQNWMCHPSNLWFFTSYRSAILPICGSSLHIVAFWTSYIWG